MTDTKPVRALFAGFVALSMLGAAVVSGPSATARDAYWHQRVSLFDTLPVYPQDIVFLGNSITDGGEFAEYFGMPNIKNRGIRSDVIDGVRERLSQVTSGHPRQIFLLIGINDVSHNLSAERIADMYRQLVKDIREQSAATQLVVQSVMPINNAFGRYRNLKGTEPVIRSLNRFLEEIAAQEGASYIDLTKVLADSKGNLRSEFTNDGLHLTGKGYAAWAEAIRPLLSRDSINTIVHND